MTVETQFETPDTTLAGRNGEEIPMRTLFVDETPVMFTHLVVTLDRMQVFLRIIPGANFKQISADYLSDLLSSFHVIYGVDRTNLAFFAALQSSPTPFDGYFQVARGTPPHKGEDGYIEFHVQPSAAVPRYDLNDSGGIDFKQLNLIENCFAGQRVASIVPPGPGRPGFDVFNNVIQPEPGVPAKIRPGPGVLISSTGRDFNSDIEGRLIFEDGILSISPLLEIIHDIDYSVGNVDFIGKVVINGTVLDGFSVMGKKGVEIKGDLNAATITSDGDVSVMGGVNGKNNAYVSCAAFSARYIDNATIEAKGDVSSDKEILHSSVKSLGKVSIPRGAIVGGEVWAFEGIEAGTAGTELGVATALVSGLSWTDENVLSEVRAKIAENSERVQAAKLLLDQILNTPDMSSNLTLDQKSMISDLIAELRTLRDNMAQLVEEKNRIVNRKHTGRVCQINVSQNLYMGVKVRFTRYQGEIKDALKGPLSIIQDEERKTFRTVGSFQLKPEEPERSEFDNL